MEVLKVNTSKNHIIRDQWWEFNVVCKVKHNNGNRKLYIVFCMGCPRTIFMTPCLVTVGSRGSLDPGSKCNPTKPSTSALSATTMQMRGWSLTQGGYEGLQNQVSTVRKECETIYLLVYLNSFINNFQVLKQVLVQTSLCISSTRSCDVVDNLKQCSTIPCIHSFINKYWIIYRLTFIICITEKDLPACIPNTSFIAYFLE